ncbi:MAG TPA: acyl-CoA dehydrogenase, partial [Sulfurimonas sp.]|nr:acyl-CoA dehydrogenase [Sulfurimonas sp.]
IVNGQKIWTSRAGHSDLMILLARTSPREDSSKPTQGLSVFMVDLREEVGKSITITPIETMINHSTNNVFFDDLRIPAKTLIGKIGEGFKYIMDGMNAERILIGAECIGDARFLIQKASEYACEREVFGRPIGQNQGIQFPIAEVHVQTEAAALMVEKAATSFDELRTCGTEANMAKLLAADASWKAADVCMQTFGGFAFAAEYDIERKFRETRLYRIAPVSTNLILSHVGTHVLGMPKSF